MRCHASSYTSGTRRVEEQAKIEEREENRPPGSKAQEVSTGFDVALEGIMMLMEPDGQPGCE